jgi:hypothetical protein
VTFPRWALALAALTAGCEWSCTKPSNAVVAPTVDTVVCILSNVAKDEAAWMPWPQVLLEVGATCGTDATTIATVWSSHVHAMAIDPMPHAVPPPGSGVQ